MIRFWTQFSFEGRHFKVDPEAAFAAAFEAKGATVAMYVVTIGALIGMANSLVSIFKT